MMASAGSGQRRARQTAQAQGDVTQVAGDMHVHPAPVRGPSVEWPVWVGDVPLPAAALQFPLAHPAVCNVLPGPRSPEELDGILAWWRAEIPDALWTALVDQGLLSPGTPVPGGRPSSSTAGA